MKKAPEAFRTISEVSDILDTPAHVLRFWESKFYQIRPVKRAGGRRYYRPDDMALLAGIRMLLQDQGMTIRGVQKVLQEQGVRHVASLAPDPSVEESFEAESLAGADEPAAVQDLDEGHRQRPDRADAPLTAPPPRPEAARPTAPLPLQPEEAPGAAPESPPDIAARPPEAARPAPADEPADRGAEPSAPDHDIAPEPPAEALDPSAPASDLPDAGQVIPEQSEPAQPPPDIPLPDLPASEPTVTTRPPVAPAPDLSEDALNLGSATDRPARVLRGLPRDALATERDKVVMLARRIDTLLDRMSDASGAGRW